MAELYVKDSDGKLQPAASVRCKNEEKELQDLLQNNPILLAGEQINPDEPRRWLLVKREMSVPDPSSGFGRWAIDLLYLDQDATLTFVECKRHQDTRARREVIAQVIEYVANSARLWTKEQLIETACVQALADGTTLEASFEDLGASDYTTPESLIGAAMNKLREHDVRIVLFMEEAPPELKTIVEFMNKEMSSVEVLLIEAKMYDVNGITIVSPSLWGFTDEVRLRKQKMAEVSDDRIKWDEGKFFTDLDQRVSQDLQRQAVKNLYQQLPVGGYSFRFGTGSVTGSFNARLIGVSNSALITVRSDGTLTIQFCSFAAPEKSDVRQALADLARKLGLALPDDYAKRYLNYRLSDWAPVGDALAAGLLDLARKHSSSAGADILRVAV